MGSIYKRGKIWHIQYYHNGKCFRETSHSTEEKVARDLLKIKEAAVIEGKIPDQIRKINLSEILADLETHYLNNELRSLRRLKISFAHLLKYFGDCPVKSITSSKVEGYIRHRKAEGKMNGTINREVAALRKAFNLAKQNGKISVVAHFSHLKESEPRKGFIEVDDYYKILEVLPPYLHLPFSLGFTVGMRLEEPLSLTWDQVDFSTQEIRVLPSQTKNKSGKTVPFLGDMEEKLVKAFSERNPNCPFVCQHNGKQIKDWRGAWITAIKKTGYEWLLRHDLKRSAIRNMVRAGIPEIVAMAIVGTKTRSIFDRYNIVSTKDFEEAKHKMKAYLNSKHNKQRSDSKSQQPTSGGINYDNNSGSYETLVLVDFKNAEVSLDT